MNSDKKSSLLYVLKILRRYTDKNHMLTYGDIARKLREEYNSDLERKTIARNIEILMDNGFDIVKNGNNGVYLGTRDFEDGELMFLTDATTEQVQQINIDWNALINSVLDWCFTTGIKLLIGIVVIIAG